MSREIFTPIELDFIGRNQDLINRCFDSSKDYDELVNALVDDGRLSDYQQDKLVVMLAYLAGQTFSILPDEDEDSNLAYLETEILSPWNRYLMAFTYDLKYKLEGIKLPEKIIQKIMDDIKDDD